MIQHILNLFQVREDTISSIISATYPLMWAFLQASLSANPVQRPVKWGVC